MAEVIILRLARKAALRRAAVAVTTENRARHGRTAAARKAEAAERDRARVQLDGHRRDGAD